MNSMNNIVKNFHGEMIKNKNLMFLFKMILCFIGVISHILK